LQLKFPGIFSVGYETHNLNIAFIDVVINTCLLLKTDFLKPFYCLDASYLTHIAANKG
jgi:hypothetical protein